MIECQSTLCEETAQFKVRYRDPYEMVKYCEEHAEEKVSESDSVRGIAPI